MSKTIKILLSIIVGIGCAVIVFIICILLALAMGLFGWSDGGGPEYLRRLETTTNLSVVISIILALLTGILVMIKIIKPKNHEKNISD